MRTAGVDLAAEPEGTAVAVLTWTPAGAEVTALVCPAGDDAVIAAVRGTVKTGIDCPLGWPEAFVAFVGAHRAGSVPVPGVPADRAWRRGLAWRHTDEVVRARTGLVPLSVSADRIGHTALRCAVLQAALAAEGVDVDRTGAGAIAEVYPAASLKIWGLPWRGYKTARNRQALGEVVDGLLAAAPWLRLGEHEALCRRSDHALDALVAALAARAVAVGRATVADRDEARSEGWIALPTGPLGSLPG
jgi:predicted nuclease with RNAse H fold